MTEKLFYQDAFLAECTAVVTACAQHGGQWAVTLDRTVFYPEGGGQPGDIGTIGAAVVSDTHEKDGEVLHFCDRPLPVGETVACAIDFPRRLDYMQQHSGEHIVSGLIHAAFGYDNVGFHMGAETVTIDFNGPLNEAQAAEIERKANAVVRENRPILISWPDAEQLKTIPYRSKKALTGAVRLVECPGADICACCGTHLRSAGEIGVIRILSVQKFREGVRMEMISGERAYRSFSAAAAQNKEISVLLSAKPTETAAAVRRVSDSLADVSYRLVGMENRLFAAIAAAYDGAGDVVCFEESLDPDGLRRLCGAVAARCGGRCAVFSGDDANGYCYAVSQPGGDVRAFVKEMNAALSGRGGGKPEFAQGSVKAARGEIEIFFQSK